MFFPSILPTIWAAILPLDPHWRELYSLCRLLGFKNGLNVFRSIRRDNVRFHVTLAYGTPEWDYFNKDFEEFNDFVVIESTSYVFPADYRLRNFKYFINCEGGAIQHGDPIPPPPAYLPAFRCMSFHPPPPPSDFPKKLPDVTSRIPALNGSHDLRLRANRFDTDQYGVSAGGGRIFLDKRGVLALLAVLITLAQGTSSPV